MGGQETNEGKRRKHCRRTGGKRARGIKTKIITSDNTKKILPLAFNKELRVRVVDVVKYGLYISDGQRRTTNMFHETLSPKTVISSSNEDTSTGEITDFYHKYVIQQNCKEDSSDVPCTDHESVLSENESITSQSVDCSRDSKLSSYMPMDENSDLDYEYDEPRKVVEQNGILTIRTPVDPSLFMNSLTSRRNTCVQSSGQTCKVQLVPFVKAQQAYRNYLFQKDDMYNIVSYDTIFKGADLADVSATDLLISDLMSTSNSASTVTSNMSISSNSSVKPNSKVNSNKNLRNLTVTINSDTKKIVGSNNNICGDTTNFKTPLLPPAKRPPSRPRKSGTSYSSGSGESFRQPFKETPDDLISLCASSIMDDELCDDQGDDNEMQSIGKGQNSPKVPNSQGSTPSRSNSEYSPVDHPAEEDAVENVKQWLNSVAKENWSPFSESTSSSPCYPQRKQYDTDNSLDSNCNMEKTTDSKCNMQNTPDLNFNMQNTIASYPTGFHHAFRGLCIRYYTNFCNRTYCRYAHKVPAVVKSRLLHLDHNEFDAAYNYTLSAKKLFEETFATFVRKWSRLKEVGKLLASIGDALRMEVLDRTPFIKEILNALMQIGMSFNQAVDEMISNQGCKNLCFTDILLNIICARHKELEHNWTLVQNIIRYRKEPIDHGVINDILQSCINSNNVEFYKNVSIDIFEKQNIDYKLLDEALLKSYMRNLHNSNFYEQLNNLTNKSGLHISSRTATPTELASPSLPSHSIQQQLLIPKESQRVPDVPTANNYFTDTDLSEFELQELVNSLLEPKVYRFVTLLIRYKGTSKAESFALNTVVTLSKLHNSDRVFMNIIKYLELEVPNYMQDVSLKELVELIAYNLINILTADEKWEAAGIILRNFMSDSFIRTREFKRSFTEPRTPVGRHLHSCKILMRNNLLTEASVIMLRKDLCILHPRNQWPLESAETDKHYRNAIVKELLKLCLDVNAIDILKKLIFYVVENDLDISVDKWSFCCTVFERMLDNYDKYKDDLLHIFRTKVLISWYKNLKRNILRALCILLLSEMSENELLNFYNRCCEREIYIDYKGEETEIVFTTDMAKEEVYMVLRMFLERRLKIAVKGGIKICIETPDIVYTEPKILGYADVGFKDMKLRISETLARGFCLYLDPIVCSSSDLHITLSSDNVDVCLEAVKRRKLVL